ncbi:Lst4 protein [Candida orthopsilosis Co 90-125]|uniref:Lst4 protein n=1 Tax=Candida orthopsilosis (strain 90-125) TaxID=1136231 RepID=H8WXF4_CANO9|nr:Lst4 protein [Candida orthopsilosis Co 90-125]CCG21460.1 Lst4 protein [Candida orthopsilosis Co 90-125]
MLGRLFKHNPPSTQVHTPPQISSSASPPITTPFEDSHSREILYGTCNANSLKPFQFNSKYFRIIISQDGGNLRSKEILFDTAFESIQQQQQQQQQQSTSPLQSPLQQCQESRRVSLKKSTNSRIYHNTTDLNDLSFGCGLPTNEVQTITKLHTLPPITNSSTSYHAVLITRLFSISDAEVYTPNATFQQGSGDDWEPKSATTTKESRVKLHDLKINSRFSIGVVIPLECGNFVHEDIINEWSEISHFLTLLQKLVYRKLLLQLNSVIDNGNGCEYLVKKRLQFPNYILQNDFELHAQLGKLVKLVHYDNNTPRLINTNYFMKLNKTSYNSSLMNWILETLNWLEFKDGRCNTPFGNTHTDKNPSFLATLMSLLMRHRKSLGSRPYYNNSRNTREVTRVVVMTGNPAVAKRLIFILNGLIANTESVKCGDTDQYVFNMHNHNSGVTAADASQSDDNPEDEKYSTDDDWNSPSTLTNSIITERANSNSHVLEVSRVKPSAVSIPINRPKSSQGPTVGIPINTPTTSQASSSLSKSASLAQLSSSLNSSYSSLQSNYSLSKFGAGAGAGAGSSGSFMEKWKNSFSNQQHTSSNNMGGYFDEPPSLGMRKPSHQSLRTPSPAFEHDDFNWQSSSYTNSIASPMSMTPSKISRTQSLYDLYDLGMNSMSEEQLSESSHSSSSLTENHSTQTSQHHGHNHNNGNGISNVFEVKRSKTSVYTPFVSDRLVKNVAEYNRSTIQFKCKQIMESSPKCKKQDTIYEVDCQFDNKDTAQATTCEGETPTTTSTIFKHNILLPCVGYCDEYRPEFILQSCPINPKLEQQVMSSMKNDLIYYQNNYKYSKITTRTIFVNLRAREIKTIEMNIDNEKMQSQQQLGNQDKSDTQFMAQSDVNEGDKRTVNGNGIGSTSTSYKTKIHKIYSPLKCVGNKRLISHVESILFQIDELFKIQQQLYHDKKTKDKKQFHDKLLGLVAELID